MPRRNLRVHCQMIGPLYGAPPWTTRGNRYWVAYCCMCNSLIHRSTASSGAAGIKFTTRTHRSPVTNHRCHRVRYQHPSANRTWPEGSLLLPTNYANPYVDRSKFRIWDTCGVQACARLYILHTMHMVHNERQQQKSVRFVLWMQYNATPQGARYRPV